jgi:hypothetical protein
MNTAQEITLWLGATRYYLGRMSYAVGDFVDMLVKKWPTMNEATQQIIRRDIEAEFERDDDLRQQGSQYLPLGQDCDRAEWERVRRLWS